MIDLHCHVLPGIDDGPPTVEDSLDLAYAARRAGLTALVATPHVSWRYVNGSQTVQHGLEALRTALRGAHVDLEVEPGAEIAVSRLGDLSDDELCRLRLGRGPWLLIEAPLAGGLGNIEAILDAVHRRGHWIVLAHPERSPFFHREPRRLQALVKSGVLCSVTAGSLAGAFGRGVQRFALALAREGLVHNVSSDAHDAVRRPPSLRAEILTAGAYVPELAARLEWLTLEVPQAIVEGDVLPMPPAAAAEGVRRHRA